MELTNLAYGTNVVYHNDKLYIVDAGTPKIGKDILVPFLKETYPHVNRIEKIFITHYHFNHTGGVPHLINNYEIGGIYSNGTFSDDTREPYASNDAVIEAEIQTLVTQYDID